MRSFRFQRTPALLFHFSVLIVALAPSVWATPVPLGEYRTRLKDSVNLVQSREGELQEEEMATLREWFPLQFRVISGLGEVMEADGKTLHHWINEGGKSPEGRKKLLAHLKSLSDEVAWEGALPMTTSDWPKNRASLDEVYGAREFQQLKEAKPSKWRAWVKDLLRRVLEWLRDRVGPIEGVSLRWVPYALYGVLILAGLILVVWILRSSGSLGWRWRRQGVKQAPIEAKPAGGIDWQALRAEAERKAGEGAFRDAVRAFFVSVLMEGHGRGWWVYQPEATNREHFSRVEGPQDRRTALRQLIDLYEEAWYGLGQPKEEAYRSCKEWLRRMEAVA
jgi:hypothetical protein